MKKHTDNDKLFAAMEFGLGDNIVSHTETTGLITVPPENEYEYHSYKEIQKYQQKPSTNQKA